MNKSINKVMSGLLELQLIFFENDKKYTEITNILFAFEDVMSKEIINIVKKGDFKYESKNL